MKKTSLFELLGKPAANTSPNSGTIVTYTRETFDDDSLLPSILDYGTVDTRAIETFDDDNLLTLL